MTPKSSENSKSRRAIGDKSKLDPATATVSLDEAIAIAEAKLHAPKDTVPAKLTYVQTKDGELRLSHTFQVRSDSASEHIWMRVSVDAHDGSIVQVVNYVHSATYKVLKLPNGVPIDGFSVSLSDTDRSRSR
jgi:hypothetical protein